MTEVFDQEAAPRSARRSTNPRPLSGWQPIEIDDFDWPVGGLVDAEDTIPYVPVADPDPKDFATAAEHTAAYLELKNHEYRMAQLWRNVKGAVYLSKCGVSDAVVDDYLDGNKIKDASPLRHQLWRFDAWTQRHLMDLIFVLVALCTVVGFGIVAAHAEINEDSAWGFVLFLIGIVGMTWEVIRRGED
ncbi:hypothetical protein [Nesterenkonia jeotgali]|uniref:Uncharacterized protein n=1 Tax=Nesterenkonia jeotgali TaxID=317018 RepID=A0A0W8ID01_9MICC|nr:hypothetical protein [Nesterenkonia jeotgali]KUG57797.1 hypothetical protein AVL63_04540 [Nesterenkonia jeotgali]